MQKSARIFSMVLILIVQPVPHGATSSDLLLSLPISNLALSSPFRIDRNKSYDAGTLCAHLLKQKDLNKQGSF